MTTTDQPQVAEPGPSWPLPGWRRPEWATSASYFDNSVEFRREASSVPIAVTAHGDESASPIAVIRCDRFVIDDIEGTLTIVEGPTHIFLDIEDLPIGQARTLAAALIELADKVDG